MSDIEEIFNSSDISSSNSRLPKHDLIFPKYHDKNHNRHDTDVDDAKSASVPGTQKIWIKTYGCSHNVSDSEYMEGILSNYGFRIVDEKSDADLWLINSCTVKDPSQAAFMHLVNTAKETQFPVVVAGCVSQADRSIPGLEDVSVVGITQIDRVVEVVEQTLNGNKVKLLAKKELPQLDLPKIRKNPLIEIIPLSTGCLGSCTYCKTKHARGSLGSYELQSILNRVTVVINEGVSEIWLSSEDTGAYGIDLGTNIAKLLKSIIELLPLDGSVMLRVGMTNPPYILEHLKEIAEILNDPRVFSFLHIPVQAGSNSVLLGMNREYTVEEFRRVADYLLQHVPDMTVATDIICGFPNETEADFDETMTLIEHYKFAIVNISQFYPRPGTPAAKMKRIPTKIVKDRSRRLTRLFESFNPYQAYVGRIVRVWFCTEVSDDNRSVGHTKSYVKVLVPLDANLPGKNYFVKISCVSRFHIEGEILVNQEYSQTSNTSTCTITNGVSSEAHHDHERHLKRQQNLLRHHENRKNGIITTASDTDDDDDCSVEENEKEERSQNIMKKLSDYIITNVFVPFTNRLYPQNCHNNEFAVSCKSNTNRSWVVSPMYSIPLTSVLILAIGVGAYKYVHKYHHR